MIQVSEHDGRKYFQATARGVSYTASKDAGGWHVHSHRLALGRHNVGSVKRFPSLSDLANTCKAFKGLDTLVDAQAVRA